MQGVQSGVVGRGVAQEEGAQRGWQAGRAEQCCADTPFASGMQRHAYAAACQHSWPGPACTPTTSLAPFRPTQGRVVGEREVPAALLQREDVLRVLPGARLPADGEVVAGRSHVDESMITGERSRARRELQLVDLRAPCCLPLPCVVWPGFPAKGGCMARPHWCLPAGRVLQASRCRSQKSLAMP